MADKRFAARLRLKMIPLMMRPVRTKAPATETLAIVTAEVPLDDVGTLELMAPARSDDLTEAADAEAEDMETG